MGTYDEARQLLEQLNRLRENGVTILIDKAVENDVYLRAAGFELKYNREIEEFCVYAILYDQGEKTVRPHMVRIDDTYRYLHIESRRPSFWYEKEAEDGHKQGDHGNRDRKPSNDVGVFGRLCKLFRR